MIQVRISTQPTRLATTTHSAALNMHSRQAQVQMKTTDAQVDIQQGSGELTIDCSACRAARGFLSPEELIRDIAQKGQQAAQEATAQYVQDGNRLAQISNPGNTVAQLATDHNTSRMQPLSINLAATPPPEISYQPAPTRVSWSPSQLRYQVQPADIKGTYTPGEVDTQVTQYASINIRSTQSSNFLDVKT